MNFRRHIDAAQSDRRRRPLKCGYPINRRDGTYKATADSVSERVTGVLALLFLKLFSPKAKNRDQARLFLDYLCSNQKLTMLLRAVAFFAAAMFTQTFDNVMLPTKKHILGTPNRDG